MLHFGIPDDDIGVRAHIDATFLGIHVENLGSIGRSNGYEASRIHLARHDALLPNQRHALFNAVDAVGNLGEVIFSQFFLS